MRHTCRMGLGRTSRYLIRGAVVLLALGPLAGCGGPALTLAGLAGDAVSRAATGKPMIDAAMSGLAARDCAFDRLLTGEALCRDAPAPAERAPAVAMAVAAPDAMPVNDVAFAPRAEGRSNGRRPPARRSPGRRSRAAGCRSIPRPRPWTGWRRPSSRWRPSPVPHPPRRPMRSSSLPPAPTSGSIPSGSSTPLLGRRAEGDAGAAALVAVHVGVGAVEQRSGVVLCTVGLGAKAHPRLDPAPGELAREAV